jgi:hypothetical protein
MDVSPAVADVDQLALEYLGNIVQIVFCEPEILAQRWRTTRTVQIKHRFTATADHVDVGGTVVVGVDDNTQSENF